jgi:cystatin-A/B
MLCGGITANLQVATPDVTALATKHKAEAEAKLGATFEQWDVVGFSTQVVAGTNYWMKVKTGEAAYIHMKVFQPLPHTGAESSLSVVQSGKAEADAFV